MWNLLFLFIDGDRRFQEKKKIAIKYYIKSAIIIQKYYRRHLAIKYYNSKKITVNDPKILAKQIIDKADKLLNLIRRQLNKSNNLTKPRMI